MCVCIVYMHHWFGGHPTFIVLAASLKYVHTELRSQPAHLMLAVPYPDTCIEGFIYSFLLGIQQGAAPGSRYVYLGNTRHHPVSRLSEYVRTWNYV